MSQTLDVKDITSIVEDGLQKNTNAIKKEIADGNIKTVKEVEAALEIARKSTETIVSDAKTQLQKDYDDFAIAIKEAQAEGKENEKPLTFGQAFSKTMKEGGFDGIQTAIKSGNLNGHTMEMKAFGTADFPGYEPFNTEYQPIITSLYDQFHWRNLLPNASTSKEFISFPKQSTITGAPGAWDYGANPGATVTKPVITPTIAPYTAKVEWIAGIIKHIEVSMLEDFGWATSFLSNLLREELLKAEDNQILNGNGTSPQLDGLLANSEAYNGTYSVGIEMIVDAAHRQLGDKFMTANAIVMSNADKVGIILNKASTSGEYNLPAGAMGYVNGRLMIDGIAVYGTPQMTAGQALVGDFNQAVLAIRSAPRLRIFDQNEDDATKNYLMMRIEERIALAIRREGAFIELNFSAS
jgi:HK97 family phage major capsid protein